MIKKFENVFFDLDGTISDSIQGIQHGIEFALKNAGIHIISDEEIKSLIGTPLVQSFKKYFEVEDASYHKAIKDFRNYYEEKGIYESRLYNGITELLSQISSDYNLYIITAKPTIYATTLLKYLNVASYFKEIKGCELESKDFKKSDFMRLIPNLENSIIIGDKPQDIFAGKEVGTKTGGVLYGYGSKEELEESNPDFFFETVRDVQLFFSY